MSILYTGVSKVKIPTDYAKETTLASILSKLNNIAGSVYITPLKLLNTKAITVPTDETSLSSYDSTISSAKAIILITDLDNTGNVYIRKSGGDRIPMPKGVSLTLQISNATDINIASDNGTEKLYLIIMG